MFLLQYLVKRTIQKPDTRLSILKGNGTALEVFKTFITSNTIVEQKSFFIERF